MNSPHRNAAILIIDDNATNLGVLTGYLRGQGLQLMVARNGRDGLAKARLGQPDLILLDVMMPDLDGFEVCRQLKATAATSAIPVIFITALQSVEDKVNGFAAGGVDYITKPLQAEEVLARVQTHIQLQLQKQHLQAEIAERKAAEDLIRQQKRLLEQTIESLPYPFYVIDVDTYAVVLANSAARRGAQIGAITCHAMTHNSPTPCAASAHRCPLQEVTRTRQPVVCEHLHADADGAPRYVEVYGFPILDESNRVTRMIEYVVDITDRKQAEDALRQAKSAADASNQAKSAFLANMSHELRTPLNGILGFAQIIRRDPDLPDRYRQSVQTIEQSGQYLLSLINDILDLAKIEAGKVELSVADVHLRLLLQSIGEMIRLRADAKHLAFRMELAPSVPTVIRADERRLRQVLLNLLGNAVKFTEQGQVTLKILDLGFEIPGQIANTSNQKSQIKNLKFEILDTGIGIAPDDLKRLCEPFQQVGDGGYRAQGTGLGLSISRNLIRLMGGDLQIASVPGQGSTFWFAVPVPVVRSATSAPPSVTREIIGIVGAAPRLLIVDDNPINCRVLHDMLTPLGFTVATAENGEQGWQMCQARPPDAIITDMRMPDMDGLAFIRALRNAPALSGIVILASSASVHEVDQQLCLTAGSAAFLPKPVERARLLNLLQQHLALTWQYREAAQEAESQDWQSDLSDFRPMLAGNPDQGPGTRADVRLTPAVLADVPADVQAGLREAINTADLELMQAMLARLRPQHTALAEALAALVDKYRFDTLLELFSSLNGGDG